MKRFSWKECKCKNDRFNQQLIDEIHYKSIISSKNFYYTLFINNNLVADLADIQLLSRSTKEYVFYCVFDVYSQYS